MSSRVKTIRKRSVSLADATFNDLVYHATERAHRAIGDACQLIEDPHRQHVLVLNVICNLICHSARMLHGDEPGAAKIAFTLKSIEMLLDRLEPRP
jgi:hypothetical protein